MQLVLLLGKASHNVAGFHTKGGWGELSGGKAAWQLSHLLLEQSPL